MAGLFRGAGGGRSGVEKWGGKGLREKGERRGNGKESFSAFLKTFENNSDSSGIRIRQC